MRLSRMHIYKMVLSAMFLAIGITLPFFTGQIPQIGNMLLPMHLPIFLCGLICGWQYGGMIGFVTPLLRSILFGMPPMITAIAMAFELMAYGAIAGYLYGRLQKQNIFTLYMSLIVAMLGGRIVWAIVRILLIGVVGEPFTWQMFLTGAFLTAIPGIVLQLVLIPGIMMALKYSRISVESKAL